MNAGEILIKYWGYRDFRANQQEIITSILQGHDTLALMPTGGGKSICYQVPAMMKAGVCLVISPLIALMKDQVSALHLKGIPALMIHSGMDFRMVKNTLENAENGNFKLLYVSPERLETELFQSYIGAIDFNLIAVDEAHCISQWGYDFRPSYMRIAELRNEMPEVPILALTASATPAVQQDIILNLKFRERNRRFQSAFSRPNLSYSVFNTSGKQNKLIQILQNVTGSAIVYCKTRKRTRQVAELLRVNNVQADFYHAGLSTQERNARQDSWIQNKVRVIVCTNAFGMGIDKPDVRVVVHYDMPEALENYYQEAGRAGRDEKRAYAVLLFNNTEVEVLKTLVNKKYPGKKYLQQVYASIVNYLQLAEGTGGEMSFDFNLTEFVARFKLEIIAVLNVLKILEQEDILFYNETFFSPSTVVFTTTKTELTVAQSSHPEFEDLIKALLRMYDGIFDYPAAVSEELLAKHLESSAFAIKRDLQKLNALGVLQYHPQKDSPQITFVHDRVRTENLSINDKAVSERKKAFQDRLKAMLQYGIDDDVCRAKVIAGYFGDPIMNCGICDVCIRRKNEKISQEEFKRIKEFILEKNRDRRLTLEDLQKGLPTISKSKFLSVIEFLIDENKVSYDERGGLKSQK